MCQLMLGRFKDGKIAKIALANASVINSLSGDITKKSIGHVDGTGIFINKKTLFKTDVPGWNINYSKINIKNGVPFILHVRKQSKGKISKENAHPFEFQDFIGAHNGTLKDKKFTGDKTDSEQFFELVQKELNKNRELSLPLAIKKVYDSIEGGKFAFLLYDKRTEEFFVIRGQATLYFVQLEKDDEIVGFIVNTEIQSLRFQLLLLGAVFGITPKEEPKLLDANSVFKVTGYTLEKLPVEIKQKNIVSVVTVWHGHQNTPTNYWDKNIRINTNGHSYWYGKKLSQLVVYGMLNMLEPSSGTIISSLIQNWPREQMVPNESYTYVLSIDKIPEEILEKIRRL